MGLTLKQPIIGYPIGQPAILPKTNECFEVKWFNDTYCKSYTKATFDKKVEDGEICKCDNCGSYSPEECLDYADYDMNGTDGKLCIMCREH